MILFTALIPGALTPLYGILIILLPMVIIPFVYAYAVYKKRRDAGLLSPVDDISPFPNKRIKVFSLVTVAIILIAVAVLMFTGNVTVTYGETAFTVDSTYWSSLTVEYASIDAIEYRSDYYSNSVRTYGFASAKLLLGNFELADEGNYTRYTYTDCKATVTIVVDKKVLVINGVDENATKAIYETLMKHTEK